MSGPFEFSGSTPGALPADSISNAEMEDMPALTVKANATGAAANPQDVAATVDNTVFGRISSTVLGFFQVLASMVGFTPSGSLSATTVQDALVELDTEKAGLATTNTLSGLNTFTQAVDVTVDGAASNITLTRYQAIVGGAGVSLRKARGSLAVPAIVATGDTIASLTGSGWNGASFIQCGLFQFKCIEPVPSATAMQGQFIVRLTPAGSVAGSEYLLFDTTLGLQLMGGGASFTVIDANRVGRMPAMGGSWQTNTPVTGFSLAISNYVSATLLSPAGTLATGTVTMPSNPVDGQEHTLISTQIITALTMSGNTGQSMAGAPTTLAANAGVTMKYRGTSPTSGTWYRKN